MQMSTYQNTYMTFDVLDVLAPNSSIGNHLPKAGDKAEIGGDSSSPE